MGMGKGNGVVGREESIREKKRKAAGGPP